jgi:hypothetical protein
MNHPIIMHINYCEQGQSIPAACRKAAAWGYDGIELRGRRFDVQEPPEAYLDMVADAARKAGLRHVLFGYPTADMMLPDAALARAVSLAEGLAAVEAARQRRLATRNLALRENGVAVTVSSKRSPSQFLNGVNDGIRKSDPLDYAYFQDGCGRGYEWMSQQPAEFPEWATITFPKPSAVAKVAVYDDFTSRAEVQVLEGDQWTTVAELARISPIALEATFAPHECRAVRVQFHAVRGLDYVRIEEIEIYAP